MSNPALPPETTIEPAIVTLLHRARHWFERSNNDNDDCDFMNSDECPQLAADLEDDLSVMLTKLGALP